MELRELLAFAVKYKARELRLAEGSPPMLRIEGDPEPRRINVPPLKQADIDGLIAPLLDDKAREALRFNGRCELAHDVKGLGLFDVKVTPGETVIVPPPAPPKAPAGDGKPGFFRKLLGGG